MIYKGIHGTCRSISKSIENMGFTISRGRGGNGVYFWRDNQYSMMLAKCWYQQRLKEGRYLGESDMTYAGIRVQIDIPEDRFVDLELPEIKDRIGEITISKGIDSSVGSKEIAALIDYFISKVEEKIGNSILMIMLRVAPPKDCNKYPFQVLGAPLSYVVRDSAVITILNIESN